MSNLILTMDDGTLGLPSGTKESGNRVDFRPDLFDVVIETKGYRIAWSRAAHCPCDPINEQTEQSDPNCSVCEGYGWFYFTPTLATIDELKVGELDGVQLRIVNNNAAVIRGIMTGIATTWQQFDPLGSRLEGQMMLTVRQQNKLGYYDRITNLDSLIVYSQVLTSLGPTTTLETRYPIVKVNLLRSISRVFDENDFTITDGRIVWLTGPNANPPAAEVRLVCNYVCHPTWLVIEHPHAARVTPIKSKRPKPVSPAGDPVQLPVQAMIRYEFLPKGPP